MQLRGICFPECGKGGEGKESTEGDTQDSSLCNKVNGNFIYQKRDPG